MAIYEGNKTCSRINKNDKDVREITKIFHWCVEWSLLMARVTWQTTVNYFSPCTTSCLWGQQCELCFLCCHSSM